MSSTAPAFVPAVVDPLPASGPPPAVRHSAMRHRPQASAIELEIDGVAVRIGRGADVDVIAAVIEAL